MEAKRLFVLRRLFFSDEINIAAEKYKPTDQWSILKDVWFNRHDQKSNAIGIERIMQLFLIALKFFTPYFWFNSLTGRFGVLWKTTGTELYSVCKLVFAIYILDNQLFFHYKCFYEHSLFEYVLIWMIAETLLYPLTQIFCSKSFPKPWSSKRNVIFIISDYIEVIFDFASLYLLYGSLCKSDILVNNSLDASYFSFVTAVTIGYGDITVSNSIGKHLVMFQGIIFLIYGVLFINFYTSKVKED